MYPEITVIYEPAELYGKEGGLPNERSAKLLEQSKAIDVMMTKSLSKVIKGYPVGIMSQL